MFEETSNLVWASVISEDAIPSQRFTVMGLALVDEHARIAVSCFKNNLRYSGLALDRCFYEAIIRTLEWMTNPKLAARQWAALPAFAAREEYLRAGGDEAKIPDGVTRDRDKYKSDHPEAFEVELVRFDRARAIMKACFDLSEIQLLSDKSAHIDTPSLAVHSRPLVAEDFFEMHADGLDMRKSSAWFVADARILEIARLVLFLSKKVREHYKLPTFSETLWHRFEEQRRKMESETKHP